MQYITIRRARFHSLSGQVNIPYGTLLESRGILLFWGQKPICYLTCENAHQFFAVNEDGKGTVRGKLTQQIRSTLEKKDKEHNERWKRVWDDTLCWKYRRPEHEDFWLWNHEFYNAAIPDLLHIAAVVRVKGVRKCFE